jgi:hypothetical protein
MWSINKLALESQQDWTTKICKHYSLDEAEAEELVLILVGGCDDALGTDYEHAHDATMGVPFQKKYSEGDGNAGINLFLALGKDIRKLRKRSSTARNGRRSAGRMMSRRRNGRRRRTT